MEQNSTKYRISPSVFYRTYGGHTVLYHTGLQKVFTFNETAGDIIGSFSEFRTAGESAAVLSEVYDLDREEMEREVGAFAAMLLEKGILEEEHRQVEKLDDLRGEIYGYFTDEHQLYSATIELTYRCNERCRHCYVVGSDEEEMDTAAVKRVLDELAEQNVFNITFTGGEVFTRKDIFEILEYACAKRFLVDIFTNGTRLGGDELIRLKSLHPHCVHFSVYSPVARKHDAVTRIPGSFEKTMRAIRACRLIGLPVNIKMPVFEETREDVPAMVELANSLGSSIEIGRNITPRKNGDLSPLQMKIRGEEAEREVIHTIDRLVETVDERKACGVRPDRICGAGENSISIDPYGEVYPCNMLSIALGNVKHQSVRDIWEHSPALSGWRDMNRKSLRKGCGGCRNSEQCVFCPGEAMMRTGDPLAMYEEACRTTILSLEREKED